MGKHFANINHDHSVWRQIPFTMETDSEFIDNSICTLKFQLISISYYHTM